MACARQVDPLVLSTSFVSLLKCLGNTRRIAPIRLPRSAHLIAARPSSSSTARHALIQIPPRVRFAAKWNPSHCNMNQQRVPLYPASTRKATYGTFHQFADTAPPPLLTRRGSSRHSTGSTRFHQHAVPVSSYMQRSNSPCPHPGETAGCVSQCRQPGLLHLDAKSVKAVGIARPRWSEFVTGIVEIGLIAIDRSRLARIPAAMT